MFGRVGMLAAGALLMVGVLGLERDAVRALAPVTRPWTEAGRGAVLVRAGGVVARVLAREAVARAEQGSAAAVARTVLGLTRLALATRHALAPSPCARCVRVVVIERPTAARLAPPAPLAPAAL